VRNDSQRPGRRKGASPKVQIVFGSRGGGIGHTINGLAQLVDHLAAPLSEVAHSLKSHQTPAGAVVLGPVDATRRDRSCDDVDSHGRRPARSLLGRGLEGRKHPCALPNRTYLRELHAPDVDCRITFQPEAFVVQGNL
jgi:hypothetical protein